MSETVTIKSFAPGNDWSSEDGKINLTFYECVFDRNGEDFHATWNKKQGTGDPPLNEPIEGVFTEKKPGDWRFAKPSKPQGGGGGGGTGSAGGKNKEWKPESQYDPEKTARIGRSHAQHMGILVCQALGTFENADGPRIKVTLTSWIDHFDREVAAAGEAAKQAQGASLPGAQVSAGSSSPAASPEPVSSPADPSLTDIEQALSTAGLIGPAGSQVASYMLTELNAEQQVNAIRKLTGSDLEAQAGAVESLKTLTVKWSGKPLPEADKDDGSDVPF